MSTSKKTHPQPVSDRVGLNPNEGVISVSHIQWSQIEAECGNFRDGFVATFRKYEGQETDEKDGRGGAVKVTAESFARHTGIPVSTFRDWLNATASVELSPEKQTRRDVTLARSNMRRLPVEEKAALVGELIKSDPQIAGAADQALSDKHREFVAARPIHVEKPGTVRDEQGDVLSLLYNLRRVHRHLAEIIPLAQDVPAAVRDKMTAAIREEIDWIRAACDAIDAGLGGDSIDQQLRELLDAEAGR